MATLSSYAATCRRFHTDAIVFCLSSFLMGTFSLRENLHIHICVSFLALYSPITFWIQTLQHYCPPLLVKRKMFNIGERCLPLLPHKNDHDYIIDWFIDWWWFLHACIVGIKPWNSLKPTGKRFRGRPGPSTSRRLRLLPRIAGATMVIQTTYDAPALLLPPFINRTFCGASFLVTRKRVVGNCAWRAKLWAFRPKLGEWTRYSHWRSWCCISMDCLREYLNRKPWI